MQSIKYENLSMEQLKEEILYSSIYNGENIDNKSAQELICILQEYDENIMRSGYIYGCHSDMVRMCQLRGFNIYAASIDRLRAMLRNNKEDTKYMIIDGHRYYSPFITDCDPKVTLYSLDYHNYDPILLTKYLESSALYTASDGNSKSINNMCKIIRGYDEKIKNSDYKLGNRSDILRICENRNISNKHADTEHLIYMLKLYDRFIRSTRSISSMEYYLNLSAIELGFHIVESSLCEVRHVSGDKKKLIVRLLDYDEIIRKRDYNECNESDIHRMCKSRNISIHSDRESLRQELIKLDRAETEPDKYSLEGLIEDFDDVSEKDKLLKKNT